MNENVAVVTGVSSAGSIAYGIAYAFAAAGWSVVCIGRHMKRASQAAKEIAAATGSRVEAFVFETARVAGENAAAKLAASVEERFGCVSVLVNAASAAKVGDRLEATKPSDLATAVETGLEIPYLLMRAFYPQLAKTSGIVVNLLSAGAASGQPGMSLLAAAKEGLRGMSRVAANEWVADNIRVVCLEPQVRTRAFEKWAAEYENAASEFSELETVEEFAARVLALA